MIDERIKKSVDGVIKELATDIDGDIPVKFANNLAYGLFVMSMVSICKKYYKIGMKEQKKKHKHKAVRRYYRRKNKLL